MVERGFLAEHFDRLQQRVLGACRHHYDERLISLLVFGSAGRAVPGPESDLDILLVADPLAPGRLARAREFRPVEEAAEGELANMRAEGIHARLSPVFKTPEEAKRGSPLFLDMVEDARLLFDRDGFMEGVLARLRQRLAELGARRVWRGNAWFWDLKPDYRIGEVFEL